jgi:hypothetical protein
MKAQHIVSALVLAATAIASNAGAAQTNGSGVNFHVFHTWQASKIEYAAFGVQNLDTSPLEIISSVDHSPSTGGQTIYIDGMHWATETTSCTLFAYDYDGNWLATKSVSATNVNGHWERVISLTAAESPTWAYYSVLCSIPANLKGVLIGVTSS